MQPCVLLNMAELLEPSITVAAFVWLFSGMDSDVLHQLMIAAEGLEALLALMRLHLAATPQLASMHLHRTVPHKYLQA